MDKDITLKDIDATLYGKVFSSELWSTMVVSLYTCCGIVAVMIITLLIGVPLTEGGYSEWNIEFFVGGSVGAVFLVVSTLILQALIEKETKKAKTWLKDAVLLVAHADSLGRTCGIRNRQITLTAIEVRFKYNGALHVRQSKKKDDPLYLREYTKYAGKRIMIAYSPTYDEVMLIKPESIQRIKKGSDN